MDIPFILELAGLFLTLMVLLYLIFGDNPLFRLVTYTFVGAASGYVAVLVIVQVLLPRLANLIFSQQMPLLVLGAVEALLGVLLFAKLSPRLSFLASLPMGILVGVGAAVAVGGAVFGTIIGQVRGTINIFDMQRPGDPLMRLLEGGFVLLGTVTTLAYFQFSARTRPAGDSVDAAPRRGALVEILAKVGMVFIGVTLGAMFAGVYTAAISALIERIGFITDVISRFL